MSEINTQSQISSLMAHRQSTLAETGPEANANRNNELADIDAQLQVLLNNR